jgi:hypothetical protein
MLRGTYLMNLRFVGQRSRSQFLMFSNLILVNQNIVWGFLTKFDTKIDSYKYVHRNEIHESKCVFIKKSATHQRCEGRVANMDEHCLVISFWTCICCDIYLFCLLIYRANMMFIYYLKNNHRTAFSESLATKLKHIQIKETNLQIKSSRKQILALSKINKYHSKYRFRMI